MIAVFFVLSAPLIFFAIKRYFDACNRRMESHDWCFKRLGDPYMSCRRCGYLWTSPRVGVDAECPKNAHAEMDKP